jgi:hypothetical protein
MKKLILIILIALTQGCVVKRKLQSGISLAFDRTLIIPVAVTQFLTEASSKIYSIDSLSEMTPVLIKKFDVKFYSKRDSLEFNFKNIQFYFKQDTLHYNSIQFPRWDLYKYSDTMQTIVNCVFASPKYSETRCIKATYKVINGVISNQKQYVFCSIWEI